MQSRFSSLWIFSCALCLAPKAVAGAWTLPKDTGQTIVTTVYDRADKSFDNSGGLISGTDFSKTETRIFTEYGYSDTITLILNTGLQTVSLSSPGQDNQTYTGITPTHLAIQKRLYRSASVVISGQIGMTLKSGGENIPGALLGDGGTDFEVRLLSGKNFALGSRKGFADIQAAYRIRDGIAPDEYRLDITTGLEWTPNIKIMGQAFARRSFGQNSVLPDYSSLQLQPSIIWQGESRRSHQIGVFGTVYGESIIRETGLLYAVWQSF